MPRQTDRVHPLARGIAASWGAEKITAVERDEIVQHRVYWTIERGSNLKIPQRRFERNGIRTGEPAVELENGHAEVTLPVFVEKGAFPVEYKQLHLADHGPAGRGGIPSWNWRGEDKRDGANPD